MKRKSNNIRQRFIDYNAEWEISQSLEETEIFKCIIATETPIDMGEYYEIIDIDSVDVTRLLDKGPVLFNHNSDEYIGVIEDVWKEDKKLYASFRFSQKDFAQQVKRDLIDGILSKFSIGFYITAYRQDGKAKDGKDNVRVTITATEFSIAPQPADVNCVAVRKRSIKELQQEINETNNNETENMEEVIKLINELKAQIESLQKTVDDMKPAEKTDEERKRDEEAAADQKKKEDEAESERKRALEESDDVVDQKVIDSAVEDLAKEIASVTEENASVDDIMEALQADIDNAVDETVKDVEEGKV